VNIQELMKDLREEANEGWHPALGSEEALALLAHIDAQAASHAEELDAYALTVSNLRTNVIPMPALLSAAPAPEPERKPAPMTESEMLEGRERTFSVDNPYCPCDRKTFMKVARYVEAFHGIFDVPAPEDKP